MPTFQKFLTFGKFFVKAEIAAYQSIAQLIMFCIRRGVRQENRTNNQTQ
jgi:hypothetical protein